MKKDGKRKKEKGRLQLVTNAVGIIEERVFEKVSLEREGY